MRHIASITVTAAADELSQLAGLLELDGFDAGHAELSAQEIPHGMLDAQPTWSATVCVEVLDADQADRVGRLLAAYLRERPAVQSAAAPQVTEAPAVLALTDTLIVQAADQVADQLRRASAQRAAGWDPDELAVYDTMLPPAAADAFSAELLELLAARTPMVAQMLVDGRRTDRCTADQLLTAAICGEAALAPEQDATLGGPQRDRLLADLERVERVALAGGTVFALWDVEPLGALSELEVLTWMTVTPDLCVEHISAG